MNAEDADVVIDCLRALLQRCESGPSDSFPECPICLHKWFEGKNQPHATDCELYAELCV